MSEVPLQPERGEVGRWEAETKALKDSEGARKKWRRIGGGGGRVQGGGCRVSGLERRVRG